MIQYLPPETIFQFIVQDFEDTWNSLSWNPSARGRGNFMFALHAMILLEFASRLCFTDASENALRGLSEALFGTEQKYSTQLPGVCADFQEFDLPYHNTKGDELLWLLFDLVRNGQAHQYQQMIVNLNDGKHFQIGLTGADIGQHLQYVSMRSRPTEHLAYRVGPDGDLFLVVRTDCVFLDVKNAIDKSGLLKKNLAFPSLSRPAGTRTRPKTKLPGPYYQFSSTDLEHCLVSAGHKKI